MINPLIKEAYNILDGSDISLELAIELSRLEGSDVVDLISLANKVKSRFLNDVHICSIINAKSGNCSEDCRYCAQSAVSTANISTYPFIGVDDIVESAELVYREGVRRFGIVTAGYGYLEVDDEFRAILKALDAIQSRMPDMDVCLSLGILSEKTARELSRYKVAHYNHNIDTLPDRYDELVSKTHSIDDRINTIKLLKEHGIKVCSGVILGLGETMEDRVKTAFVLRELDVDVIPINVLIPIKGTPLEGSKITSAIDVVKAFAIFRLINPKKVIKFAAGRETIMKDFQALIMLSGANGFLTGGYLTTRGRSIDDDKRFYKELEAFN